MLHQNSSFITKYTVENSNNFEATLSKIHSVNSNHNYLWGVNGDGTSDILVAGSADGYRLLAQVTRQRCLLVNASCAEDFSTSPTVVL